MTRKLAFALLALAVALAVGATAAYAASAGTVDEPGVTPTSILVGGTASKMGQASSFAAVAVGAAAYLAYVNERGGVNGRRIEYTIRNDSNDPAQALRQTQQLVEQGKVFAIFNTVGTDASLGIRDYLNQKQVPLLFAASGATALGAEADRYPLAIGFRPSYTAEGWVLGQYLARTQGAARVAVLFQGDDYGTELLQGLRAGIERSKVKVVAAQPVTAAATDVRTQVQQLRSSGATVFAVLASSKATTQAYRVASTLGWKPKLTVDTSAASAAGVLQQATAKGAGALARGTISVAFLKNPTDSRWNKDPGMKLYRRVLKRFAAGANVGDVDYVYGMASAWALVEAIRKAGDDLTRQRLVQVIGSLDLQGNPFLLPGIALRTGPDDHSPIDQMLLQRWHKGAWRSFGGLWAYRG